MDIDLVLVATSSALGRGDGKGMQHFLKHFDRPIDFCISLVANNIGRIDHYCNSSVRGDVVCSLDSVDEWSTVSSSNAVLILNQLVNDLLSIPMANRYKTMMNIGQIKGGESYSLPCSKSSLGFYVSSEIDEQVEYVMSSVKNCCIDVAAKTNSSISIDFFSYQKSGGLRFTHPFVKTAVKHVSDLGYKPVVSPRQSQASIPMSLNIPTIVLGMTAGLDHTLSHGRLEIKPIINGIKQTLLMLESIMKGKCDDE